MKPSVSQEYGRKITVAIRVVKIIGFVRYLLHIRDHDLSLKKLNMTSIYFSEIFLMLSIDQSNLPNRIFTVYGRTVTVRYPYRERLKLQKIRPYAYGRLPLRHGAQP